MNAETIRQEYSVNKHNYIISPGKFEGEPIYSVYFWDMVLSGGGDDTVYDDNDRPYDLFVITEDDIATFPDLEGFFGVCLHESNTGFVFCELVSKQEYKRMTGE